MELSFCPPQLVPQQEAEGDGDWGLLMLLLTSFTKISFSPHTENHCDLVLSTQLTSLKHQQFD